MPPIPVPPAGPGPNWGSGYSDVYPAVGLSALTQGLTQGVMTGLQMRQQQEHMAMQRDQMAQQQAYHNALLGLRNESIGNTASHQKAMENILGGDPATALLYQRGLENHTIPPELLSALSGTGIAGAALRQKAVGGALAGGYSPKEGQLEFAGEKYEKGSQAQTRQRVAKAVSPLIDQMNDLVDKSDLSDYPLVNTARAWGAKQAGKTKYTDLQQKASLIADEIQSMVGVGSDAKLRLIQGISDPANQGKKQLKQGLANINAFLASRSEAFGGGDLGKGAGKEEMPIHTYDSGRKVQWNGSAWVPYNE